MPQDAELPLRIGTAGWSLGGEAAAAFAGEGHQLQRYACRLNCVEINSSFYRPHKPATYARWAALTPPGFRFAVKAPRTVTHEARLGPGGAAALERFLDEAGALGEKLAIVLVQMPPSLAFEARAAGAFFERLHGRFGGAVVCEPRHPSWFTPAVDRTLLAWRVARAGADPARSPGAERPGGWLDALLYLRWHGSPQIYRSRYTTAWLQQRRAELAQWPAGIERWCIFDNTASGAALLNALELRSIRG